MFQTVAVNWRMTMTSQGLSRFRLLQFLSPAAPVGSFSYSQGLEWAVESAWISNEKEFSNWIQSQIASVLPEQELPLLIRLYESAAAGDQAGFAHWGQFSLALRDTAELRNEELARADAYVRILDVIEPIANPWQRHDLAKTPLASLAYFSVKQFIDLQSLLEAYAHFWLETSIVNGVKIIPLGQSAGQRMLFELSPQLIGAINTSRKIDDDQVGLSLPAMSHASSCHEVQYSRVYRS